MNLIVYGSLMHPAEFAALAPNAAIPVWVHGFRRAFDQTPMWRGDGKTDHTVLAVRPDRQARFNGILLVGIATERTATLDHRERGYIRTPVPPMGIEPFAREDRASFAAAARSACEVYVGRSEQQNALGTPLGDYFALCREASASWGEPFTRAFELTTLRSALPDGSPTLSLAAPHPSTRQGNRP